jgi:hypothetical protein
MFLHCKVLYTAYGKYLNLTVLCDAIFKSLRVRMDEEDYVWKIMEFLNKTSRDVNYS